jgi:hypothetical protein
VAEASAVRDLVLHADRDLRHPRVLIPDGVARDLQLRAEDVLAKGVAAAEAERRARSPGIEILMGVGHLDPVEQAERDAVCHQIEIGQRHRRAGCGAADAGVGLIARDQRPCGKTAARRSFRSGDAVGEQQLAAPATIVRRRLRGQKRDHRRQPDRRPSQHADHSSPYTLAPV